VKQVARFLRVSHADLPPSVLWRNQQTEAHLVLRPKLWNHRGDFDAQITKSKLPVLRPKPENPQPPWFWGSTKKSTTGFEAKSGETVAISFEVKLEKTVATSFEAKLEKIIATSFEAKPDKTVAAGFEAKLVETVTVGFEVKPAETVAVGFEAKLSEIVTTDFETKPTKTVQLVLRPNHSQTVTIGFEAQTNDKSSEWFWGQTTHKPSNLVLKLNQETRAPHLYVHGADRTWRHPTSRSPGHRVPDMCYHPRSSAPGLLLLPRSSSLHTTRQANAILQMKQI
jgi:hypothetical protein